LLANIIAKHSGQEVEKIQEDSERDNWFSAEEAAKYGLIDKVIFSVSELSLPKIGGKKK
jgi:ATP-dependent Clp protease protease subunit